MPRPKKPAPPASSPELNIPKELLNQLVCGPMTQGDLEAMFRSLKKAVIERAMGPEMSEHLGYGPGQAKPDGQRNHRNGASPKTVLTDDEPVRIEVPRCKRSFCAYPLSGDASGGESDLQGHGPQIACLPMSFG
jgi:hypothetical protein